jgi:hypothetical protein
MGNYRLSFIGSTLKPVTTSIGSNFITFSGCNTITIPSQTQVGGIFRITGSIRSTSRVCPNNNDNQYVQILRSANGYGSGNNGFYLTNQGKRIARFVGIGGPRKYVTSGGPSLIRGPTNLRQAAQAVNSVAQTADAISSSIGNQIGSTSGPFSISSFMRTIPQGRYTLKAVGSNLAPIVLTISQQSLGFVGCNALSIPFLSIPNFSFPSLSNCQTNNYQKYMQLFGQATGYSRGGNAHNYYLTCNGNNIAQLSFSTSPFKVY